MTVTRYSVSPAQLYVHGESLPSKTVGVYLAADFEALLAKHLKLRDRLLESADSCKMCSGEGIAHEPISEWTACPQCADIRAALEE